MRCANRSPIADHRSPALALEELDWIPRPKILALRRLGIETAEDLLTHFPRRHEDRTEFPHFPREESDSPICLCGEVIKLRCVALADGRKFLKRRFKSRRQTLSVSLWSADGSTCITCRR